MLVCEGRFRGFVDIKFVVGCWSLGSCFKSFFVYFKFYIFYFIGYLGIFEIFRENDFYYLGVNI